METDTLIEACRLILQSRYTPDVVGFNSNNNVKCTAGEMPWYANGWVRNYNGQDCLAKYGGAGASQHAAYQNLFFNIVRDFQEGYEAGMG